jgi:hypothetical protein
LTVRRRLGVTLLAAVLSAGLLAGTVAGCGPSTRERLTGTWTTGSGGAAGEVEFTADGLMKRPGRPVARFTVNSDELRIDSAGETNPTGRITWLSADKFTYTVLGKTCAPVVLTYERKR